MKMHWRSHLFFALGAIAAMMGCRSTPPPILNRLELRRPGVESDLREFPVGDHIQISCQVSGLKLNEYDEYDIQADALLSAADPKSAGGWKQVWAAYSFYQENKKPARGMAGTWVQTGIAPPVGPGSYRLTLVIRDMNSLKRASTDVDIRIASLPPRPSAEESPTARLDETTQLFQKACATYQSGDLKVALVAFMDVAQRDPRFPEVNFSIGMIQSALGDKKAARESFDRELSREPNHFSSLSRIGDLLVEQNDFVGAIGFYQRAAKVRPNEFYPPFKLGEVYLLQKQYDEAIRAFNNVLGMLPDHVYAMQNLGSAYYRKGDNENAIRVFASLAARSDAPAQAHLYYSMALYKAKQYALARSEAYKAKAMGAKVDSGYLEDLDKLPPE